MGQFLNSKPILEDYELSLHNSCYEKMLYICGQYYPETHVLFQCKSCFSSYGSHRYCWKEYQLHCGAKFKNGNSIYQCKNCFKIDQNLQVSICQYCFYNKITIPLCGENAVYQIHYNQNDQIKCQQCISYDKEMKEELKIEVKSICNKNMKKKCGQMENSPRYYYTCNYERGRPCFNKEIILYCGMINSLGYQIQCSECYIKDLKKNKEQKQDKRENELEGKCKVCFVESIDYIFSNCGHAVVCEKCIPQFRHSICPLCRKEIGNKLININKLKK